MCTHVQRDAVWPDNISLMKLPAKMRRWKFHWHRRKRVGGGGRSAAGSPLLFLFDTEAELFYMCVHIGGALQVFNYDAHLSSRRRSGVEPQKKNSTSSIRSSHVQLCALCSSVFFPYNIREKTYTNREQRRHLTIRVHIYIYIEGYCKDTALVIEI